tara:strand:- start:945 stop:1307 length:363 start_codon:yes stop_codon:yes gene_type:complete
MSDPEFADGLIIKEGKVEFIHCTISINKDQFIEWLSTKDDQWINIDVKTSRAGKIYGQVNSWKPVTDGMTGGSDFQKAIDEQKANKDTGLTPSDALEKIKKDIDNIKPKKDDFADDEIPF